MGCGGGSAERTVHDHDARKIRQSRSSHLSFFPAAPPWHTSRIKRSQLEYIYIHKLEQTNRQLVLDTLELRIRESATRRKPSYARRTAP
jgi:hypothetical protein